MAVHVAVLAGLAVLQEPEPKEPPKPTVQLAEVQLITMPDALPTPPPTPQADTTPTPKPEPESKPEPAEPHPDHRRRSRRRASAEPTPAVENDDRDGKRDDDSTVSLPPSAPPSAAGTEALGLSGLRGPHRLGPPSTTAQHVPLDGAHGPARPRDTADVLEAARTPEDVGFERKRGRLIHTDPIAAAWTAELLPDGRVHFRNRKSCGLPGPSCWTKAKRRLLAASFSVRLKVAKKYAKKNIARQMSQMNRDLLAIWRSSQPPRTRRKLIFEVWDECEESPAADLGDVATAEPSVVDVLRHRAGQAARRKIIAFVQAQLPADSANAFAPAELLALNGRRLSRERFEPYQQPYRQ